MQVTWADAGRPTRQNAYTLDVSRKGARLAGVTGIRDLGQLIAVRRKTSEARFRVVWIGQPRTPQEGQIGVECVDPDKIIWDVDFANVHEDFEVVESAKATSPAASKSTPVMGRKPLEYPCPGAVKVWTDGLDSECVEARLTSIDGAGCRLEGDGLLFDRPLVLQISIGDVQLTLKGSRCRNDSARTARIEFSYIRRGDRPVLEALISRLAIGKRP